LSGNWYTVGIIVNTHGIKGELKVLSRTDFADIRFAPGSKLRLVDNERGISLDVKITSSREQKNMFVIKLEGFNNINDVEKYKGASLMISEDAMDELEEGEYYYHEIIGCQAVTEDGEQLGVITEILSPGANDVWVIERPKGTGKPILLPVIDDVLLSVDVTEKRVTVRLLEGLI